MKRCQSQKTSFSDTQLTTPVPIVWPGFVATQSDGLGITIASKRGKWILCVNLGRRTKNHENENLTL